MADNVVTARGDRMTSPYIVAAEAAQRAALVRLGLRDPGYSGVAARTHFATYFYVWDKPVGLENGAPRRHLRVGFFARFGGAMFYDDPRAPGDNSATDRDWTWLALRPRPLADIPTVYFEQEGHVPFPPRCVMPVDELETIVREYVDTGERPASVGWLTVNALHWELDGAGDITAS